MGHACIGQGNLSEVYNLYGTSVKAVEHLSKEGSGYTLVISKAHNNDISTHHYEWTKQKIEAQLTNLKNLNPPHM